MEFIEQIMKDKSLFLQMANTFGRERGFNINGLNDEGDAFRHGFVSGMMARKYGQVTSDLAGQINEILRPNSFLEKNMDLWNNRIGRERAILARSPEHLADLLAFAIKNGQMITNPDIDPRREFPRSIKEGTKNFPTNHMTPSEKKHRLNRLHNHMRSHPKYKHKLEQIMQRVGKRLASKTF